MIRDLEIKAGDTKIIALGVQTPERQSITLLSAVITFQAARTVSSVPVISKTLGNGITITDVASGKFEILLEPEDTDLLGGKTYYYEVEVKFGDGTVSTVIEGDLEIKKTLIRSS